MNIYSTTSRDAYRDPKTYSAPASISPNVDARVRRRREYETIGVHHIQDHARHVHPSSIATVHTWPPKQHTSSIVRASYPSGSSSQRDLKARQDISLSSLIDLPVSTAAKIPRRSDEHAQGTFKTTQSNDDSYINQSLLDLEDQIRATIYGHCIGDAIGLLTEFMSKNEAYQVKLCTMPLMHAWPKSLCIHERKLLEVD